VLWLANGWTPLASCASRQPQAKSVGVGQPSDRPIVTVSLHHIVIDAHDLSAQARFWTEVLNWRILSERDASTSYPHGGQIRDQHGGNVKAGGRCSRP